MALPLPRSKSECINTSKKKRKYPELDVGDKVRIMRKKGVSEKERASHWLKGKYAVEKVSRKGPANIFYIVPKVILGN